MPESPRSTTSPESSGNILAVALQHKDLVVGNTGNEAQFRLCDLGGTPLVAAAVDREPENAVALEGPERLGALLAKIDRFVQADGTRAVAQELNEDVVRGRQEPGFTQDLPPIRYRISKFRFDSV